MRSVEAVLYIVPPELELRTRAEMENAGGRPRRGAHGKDWMVIAALNRTYQFRIISQVPQAITLLTEQYFNFVVLDCRLPNGSKKLEAFEHSLGLTFLGQVHHSGDPDKMFPFSRIIAVLDTNEHLPEYAFAMGKWRIGGFVVNPFQGSIFEKINRLSAKRTTGKTAICLSGGGVEGLLFELGVLEALNAHLQSRSVTDFDIFCGISAGAMLASLLANNVEPEELVKAIISDKPNASTVDPIDFRIMFDVHLKEVLKRLWTLGKKSPITSWDEFISNLIKTFPSGVFRGEGIRRFVENELSKPGRTNDFRKLNKELYIGSTEQDTSNHTIFGQGQWDDIPISKAIRASSALTPFFEPEKIRGRFFVDGQYTRTSNFHVAIEHGAKLVIVIYPLIPIKVEQPGYVRAKGGIFAGLQALKAVIHTRFMHAIRHAAESHPEVDFVLFTPESEDMRLMSGSPMKYTVRTEIINMAYRCAVRKIQQDFEILSYTFAKHNLRLQRFPRLRMPHNEIR